jgi:hypothetical protein
MLQRIQTIWLLLAATCSFVSLKITFYAGNLIAEGTTSNDVGAFSQITGMDNPILTTAVGVMSLICIFLYKNRKQQIKFCIAAFFIEISLLIFYYFLTKTFKEGTLAIGAGIHLLIIIFILLAISGIRKDNKIIADSDRLR